MNNRAADATIKGYYYQFDTTILKLLELKNEEDVITIEGIEDIDINSATAKETIQCKYLSKPKFTDSSLREPITLMLDNFLNKATSNSIKYTLYVHFTEEKPGEKIKIDLPHLKTILTYTEKKISKCYYSDNNVKDADLIKFLEQFEFVFGEEFDKQQQKTIQKLKHHYSCSDFDADKHYYNNALRVVIDKAKEKKESDRKVSKRQFLNSIDCSKKLFNEWFIKLRSKDEYLKSENKNLKDLAILNSKRPKSIIIGKDILQSTSNQIDVDTFIEVLNDKYYKIGKSFWDAHPLTFVLDCTEDELKNIKTQLIKKGIVFNDGFEHIYFSESYFNQKPIINRTTNNQKLLKASYLAKIISKKAFDTSFDKIHSSGVILFFSKESLNYSFGISPQVFDFKYCENLKDILTILN